MGGAPVRPIRGFWVFVCRGNSPHSPFPSPPPSQTPPHPYLLQSVAPLLNNTTQLASIEAAGKAALASASAALRRALSPAGGGGGGGQPDRVASLLGRLEERASASVLEERSEFDRVCAASMMTLGSKVRW